MLRDVQAEDFLLEPQQFRLLELLAGDRHVLELLLLAEERALPEQPVGLRPRAVRERRLESLERPLVRCLRVDPLAELPDRRERPALLAPADDRARRRLADVLHGREPETDLPLDDREVE